MDSSFNGNPNRSSLNRSNLNLANPLLSGFRHPRRITATIPYTAYQRLLERSDEEGRSLSNLAAFLLEKALDA